MSTFNAAPWFQGKWQTAKQDRLEEGIQTLDLVLKILVPAALLISLVVAIKFGSFNGYLKLLSRQSYATPLMALGTSFTIWLPISS